MPDTLDDVLRDCLDLLREGVADPASPWRSPALASTDGEGHPQVRTVVLRRFDAAARMLETHTDIRSAKFAELAAHPFAGVHGWDAGRRVQLRLSGPTSLHTGDTVAESAWAALSAQTRGTYRVTPGPGTVLTRSGLTRETDDTAARQVFCVVRLKVEKLEWLHLAQGSHRRARFTWATGAATSMWLVP